MFDVRNHYHLFPDNDSLYDMIPMEHRNHLDVEIILDGSVRIRYRGPRRPKAHDTLKKDATHFSIYRKYGR